MSVLLRHWDHGRAGTNRELEWMLDPDQHPLNTSKPDHDRPFGSALIPSYIGVTRANKEAKRN